ncbi:ABC transporter ATP-binding protein [Polycladidibacter hongkongensis]|uniref:ABC transporter ATP-binding protein n=1 Tax=Polycladidibacter hongkongensis TaxID=1647556 RepID=UPI00083026B6|nr:ABC transporter ATP-binding protein [Pseudovibrio hongkongensis]
MTLLRVQDLQIKFSTPEGEITAVDHVSFEVNPGEVLGLVGESGSGKSVTARALMQLNASNTTYGENSKLLLETPGESVDILALKSERQRRKVRGDLVSMIFQEPMASFAPALTIGSQMCEQLKLHRGLRRPEAKDLSIQLLSRVGISDAARRFDQYAFELSGGMRQRAMIAMALSTKPSLLIADEPTTALDVTIQAQVIDLMKEIARDFGMGIIFITHDLGVIAQTADRVAVMYLGKIVESGPVREVLHNPAHPYTRGLINALPKLEDLEAQLTPVPGDIPSPLERPAGCVFHTRCPQFSKGTCEHAIPPQHLVGNEHFSACHLHEEALASTLASAEHNQGVPA